MEGGKKSGSSSCSFSSELFGAKGSSAKAQSSRTLASILAPSAAVSPWQQLSEAEKQKESAKQVVAPSKTTVSAGRSKDNIYTTYYEEEKTQPLNYSSSIYYGGQDYYGQPLSPQNDTFNKDVEEDESGSASRGNWWKGSLYY